MEHLLRDFYQKRPVAVTGGASFIGSYLTEALVRLGASVRVADNLVTGKLENLQACLSDIRFQKIDLRNQEYARDFLQGASTVFHLAAIHGGRGFIDSHGFECTGNMGLDHSVFAAAAQVRAQKVIFASSACVYPVSLQETPHAPLREENANLDSPGAAFSDGPYGWAKLMGELQLRALHRQFGIDGIACRLFTAYGPRESSSHALIALLERALLREDPFAIWGDGQQTRNFTYVEDIVTGLLLSGAMLTGFETVNVGSAEAHSINDTAERIFSLLQWRPAKIQHLLDRPTGPRHRVSCNAKVERLLGWKPRISLDEGLRLTLASLAPHFGKPSSARPEVFRADSL